MAKLEQMDHDDIEKIVGNAIESAVDFVKSEIEDDRQKAQRYFDGEVDIEHEEGRSKVVATKCRDAVRQVKPSLMRVFMSSPKPVEFVPTGPDDVAGAEQQTKYAQFAFTRAGGYKLLNSAVHDALVKKTGFLKAWWETTEEVTFDVYEGLTDEQFAYVTNDDTATVVEHSERQIFVPGDMGEIPVTVHDAKVSFTTDKGKLSIKAIPPEDFFVDSNATELSDAYISGHRSTMRIGDLVAMGFEFDDVSDLGEDDDDDEAELNRRGYTPEDEDDSGDPSMKAVTVYEAYMRMDIEGVGIPKLYSFILAGSEKKLLRYDLADFVPFAVFEVDPEPHAFFGRSLVDILLEDQDAATSMMRGLIDNVMMANNPRMAFDENAVNTDDLMNNEIGALVRTKGSPATSLMPVEVPFTAGTTLPAMQYFDEQIEGKTGVSRASFGLNPDVLRGGNTAAGVNAAIAGGELQVEGMARNLAESGMTQLFRIILQIVSQYVGADEMMQLDGNFVPVDPRSWRIDMDMQVNVGLGSDRQEERAGALQFTLAQQQQLQAMGSPLVTLTNIRNTLADIQAAAGIHNSDRYFAPMSPEIEQQIMQAQQQAMQEQGQPQDPNQILAQAEVQKAQINAEVKQQGDMVKAQIEQGKAQMLDDRERDKMAQDLALKSADLLGKYQMQVNQQAIRQEQEAPRF